jgi:hypothetical protein
MNEDKAELDPSQDFVGVKFRTRSSRSGIWCDSCAAARVFKPESFFSSWGSSTRWQIKCLRAACTCAPSSSCSSQSGAPTRTPWTGRSGDLLGQVWNFWGSELRLLRGVSLAPPAPEMSMFTDASLYGWGAHVGTGDLSAKGTWTVEESRLSINILGDEGCHSWRASL